MDEEGLYQALVVEPSKFPGCSGSRCYQDNITDLKAQVAANHCGIRLIRQLVATYTMDVVHVGLWIPTTLYAFADKSSDLYGCYTRYR